uniref:Uncharacterized protein n=1 Tax=Physcomitrium patens TaxID=3218 RepID=A0A2K1J2D8_PHYPA|nr:hypothetical protein PHYPA_021536 [Physcomitrium patens]
MPPSLKAKLVGTPARRNSSQGLSSGERKPLHNDNDSTTINEEADGIEDERGLILHSLSRMMLQIFVQP